MSLVKKSAAELLGTFLLVFAGCGAAILSAGVAEIGIGLLGVALAFGLVVMAMAFTIGHISGCHLNPAISIGLVVGGRFKISELPAYVIAQFVGGALGAFALYYIVSSKAGFVMNGFASNGFGDHSPGGYPMMAGFIVEMIVTGFFMLVIMGSTDKRVPPGFAPIAIGMALTVLILASVMITNASLNPARSTATALVQGGWALNQLWMFLVAPVLGAISGALIYRWISNEP